MEGSAPAVDCPSQGAIDVESLDSLPKVALDPSPIGTDTTQMCIDSQGPAEDALPSDIPVPSSPSSSYSWTPLFDEHCGSLQGDSKVIDLKHPRPPPPLCKRNE